MKVLDNIFQAYNITHSLILWSVLFALLWAIRRHPPWIFLAWGLHILCDIPTHTLVYFPTPYLWPFTTPFIEGISWATGWFMVTNYTAILLAYLAVFVYRRIATVRPG